ncbi:MAG: hypothetical protein IKX88_16925, partial [Thermoguttaceae bacterium]|nr:hypothetical protein [Thermoguttaceae bacterium]
MGARSQVTISVPYPLYILFSEKRKKHGDLVVQNNVFNNKVYLYPSHDIMPPAGQRQDWFCMEDYHVFSSENLTDWTDHGVIV